MSRHRQLRKAPSSGFTLLEVVIASFILAVSALALCATMATGTQQAERGRDELLAQDIVQGVVADIEQTPFDQVAARYHLTGFPVPGLKTVAGDHDGLPGEIVLGEGPNAGSVVYRLTVRVRWQGRAGARMIESVHVLSNVRGDPGVPTPPRELIQPYSSSPPYTRSYLEPSVARQGYRQ